MATEEIPVEIHRFMYERITSYEQLEVLVRLAESSEPEDVTLIATALGVSSDVALEALDSLVGAGLLARLGRERSYRYAPREPALDAAARELVALYRVNRFAVVKAMSDHSFQRLRSSALHTFAECFLIGGPKKDG